MSTSLHGAVKAYHNLIPKLKGSAFDDNRVNFKPIISQNNQKRWTLSQLLGELSPQNALQGLFSLFRESNSS